MNKNVRGILDVLFFIVVFFLIQYVVTVGVAALDVWVQNGSWSRFYAQLSTGGFQLSGKQLVLASVLGSALTLTVFTTLRWALLSRAWLSTHPWQVLAWVVFASLGSILPSEWLQDQLALSLPVATQKMFAEIMGEPTGYLAIGILAPLAEELVFRGAVLRTLLRLLGPRRHGLAILVSAVLFGAVHLNLPQFVHATLIGLLLGWMYYRTDSIIPGVVFHWINNTVAYIMFNLMPQMADGKLIDLFHGDSRMMWMGLAFSICILLPSLLQLSIRLKRAGE